VRKIEGRLPESHLDAVEPVCRREGESMLHEEVILHLHDTVVVSLGIDNNLIEYGGIDIPLLFSELLELIEFSTFYELESLGYVYLDRFISPEVPICLDFLLGEAVIYEVGKSIIKVKRTHTSREEVTESPISFHTREYLFC
jgi:hypothetical protein